MRMEIKKLYSTLTLKSYDEDKRIIKGIASTPATDRDGDTVNSKGAKFTLPYPLLSSHSHDHPVGEVIKSEITSRGIEVTAKIFKGTDLQYVEDTWKKVKAGLIKGLSIGFRGIDVEAIATGYNFKTFEVFELSLVAVPANQQATITSVKHFCSVGCDKSPDGLRKRKRDIRKRAAAYLVDNKKT